MKARRIDYRRVPELAAAGLPYDAIAKEIGCSYSVLTVYCRKHGIAVVSKVSTRSPSAAMLPNDANRARVDAKKEMRRQQRANEQAAREQKKQSRIERAEKMAAMFRQGLTLQKIADHFEITRERVRAVLKTIGVDKKDGGQAQVTKAKKEKARIDADAKWIKRYGFPYAVMREFQAQRLTHAWHAQRRSARLRGIEWNLDFKTWITIWQTSGKLHLRGRGNGKYVMSRVLDAGAYELGNVHIQLATENSRDAVKLWRGKPKANRGVFLLFPGREKAWLAVVSGVRLGYFSSEKDAVAAQVAYCEANGITLVETKGAAGSGRGWTYRPGGGKLPYQVVLAGKYIGVYATESEAVSAYKAAAHDLRMANAFLPAPAQQEAS